jgi:hypothetical protein
LLIRVIRCQILFLESIRGLLVHGINFLFSYYVFLAKVIETVCGKISRTSEITFCLVPALEYAIIWPYINGDSSFLASILPEIGYRGARGNFGSVLKILGFPCHWRGRDCRLKLSSGTVLLSGWTLILTNPDRIRVHRSSESFLASGELILVLACLGMVYDSLNLLNTVSLLMKFNFNSPPPTYFSKL